MFQSVAVANLSQKKIKTFCHLFRRTRNPMVKSERQVKGLTSQKQINISNTMKKQSSIIKSLVHAVVLLIAAAVASPARADTTDFGDLNKDGLDDVAVITGPTTVTVSLADLVRGYIVNATLSVPKNRTINYVDISDLNEDGILDVYASGPAGGDAIYTFKWLGIGDGTFGALTTGKWSWPRKGGVHGYF